MANDSTGYQFQSHRQQNWYFQNLEDQGKYIKNYGRQANYYSASTGWIYRSDLEIQNPEYGLMQIGENFEDWLISKGFSSIKEQMDRVNDMPWWISWIAKPETTGVLFSILSLLSMVEVAMIWKAAGNEAFWATYVTKTMPTSTKAAWKTFFTSQPMRQAVTKNNMMNEIARMKPGDMTQFFKIVEAYKPFLSNAEEVAKMGLSYIRGLL